MNIDYEKRQIESHADYEIKRIQNESYRSNVKAAGIKEVNFSNITKVDLIILGIIIYSGYLMFVPHINAASKLIKYLR